MVTELQNREITEQAESLDTGLVDEIMSDVLEQLRERAHVPAATYRLQFNRFFTFKQARALVDYFDGLGVSDLYASPYFKARPESLHGYDIVDHNELNSAIGSEDDYNAMVDGAAPTRHVPDTRCRAQPHGHRRATNAWWMDVLENGRSSVYAPYFDIDWDPVKHRAEQQGAAADPGRPVRQGARERRAAARLHRRGRVLPALLRARASRSTRAPTTRSCATGSSELVAELGRGARAASGAARAS